MALFLVLIIVAIALGIIGAVVKGLLYLLIIGHGGAPGRLQLPQRPPARTRTPPER